MPTRLRLNYCRALLVIALVRLNLSSSPGLPPAKSGPEPIVYFVTKTVRPHNNILNAYKVFALDVTALRTFDETGAVCECDT